MDRYIIGSLLDRNNRNGANKNFEYLFEGRRKIDELNSRAEGILTEAKKTNNMNKDVQQQINTLIAESGTSDAEVIQARGGFAVLNERLKKTDKKINVDSKVDYSFLNLIESGDISKIKLIGDSITVGVAGGGAEDKSRPEIGSTGVHEADVTARVWSNFFREYINKNYPSIDFFNAGIGGWSASGNGLTQGTNWYGTDNDMVFIMLGTNDRRDCQTEAEFKIKFEEFVKNVEQTCNHLIVMTAPPTLNDYEEDGTRSSLRPLAMEQIDKVISNVCAENGWKHISFYREFLKYQFETQTALSVLLENSGGSHPIHDGYLLMWKILQQELGLIENAHAWENQYFRDSRMKVTSVSGSLYSANEPISSFQENSLTYLAVGSTHPDLTSFPEKVGGTMLIVRPYSDSFGYREYTTLRNEKRYISYWLGTSWSEWDDDKAILSGSGSSVTNSTPISEFPKERVSYYAIAAAHPDIANFPTKEGGVLKVVRTYSDSFSYQEYIVLNKGFKFTRYPTANGWRGWVMSSNLTGSTGARTLNPVVGMMYFDQGLNKPIWWTGNEWVDATGATV